MKAVGILGGGQPARMMALSAHSLGLDVRVFDPDPLAPAASVAVHVCAGWDDVDALEGFADSVDVVTLDLEALPATAARTVAARTPLRPSPDALAATQDRLAEKELARSLGIPVGAFERIDRAEDLDAALAVVGVPAILKCRTDGYDGRGQAMITGATEARRAWEELGGRPSILEARIDFRRELSLVAVRAQDGATAFYPLVENRHRNGMLHTTLAPAPRVSAAVRDQAHRAVGALLEALDYVGVFTVEFFEHRGRLLFNEMAPRVHNSGHWTIEGAATSQFENHLRAVCGFALGATEARGRAAMHNVVSVLPDTAALLAIPGVHVHLYGKEPRPGRKLGHVTVEAGSAAELAARRSAVDAVLAGQYDDGIMPPSPPAAPAAGGNPSGPARPRRSPHTACRSDDSSRVRPAARP